MEINFFEGKMFIFQALTQNPCSSFLNCAQIFKHPKAENGRLQSLRN